MPGPDCLLQLDKIMCDLTCTWTKRLVTWLVFGPNDLWLDLTWRRTKWLVTWLGLAGKWLVTWLGLTGKWLVTWLGLAGKWLVTWLGLARKWLATWLGLAKNDLLPSLHVGLVYVGRLRISRDSVLPRLTESQINGRNPRNMVGLHWLILW